MEQWEAWLRQAGGPPPKQEDAKRRYTEARISAAVAEHPALASLPLRVFTKGSFANRTNIRLESDVDVVVECGGHNRFFYYDCMGPLLGAPAATLGIRFAPPPCSSIELKGLLLDALQRAFGSEAVTPTSKAVRVRSGRLRLMADVVPAFRYHLYYGIDERGPLWLAGHRLFPDAGPPITNWPDQHYAAGVDKNSTERTLRRYKRLVRALKSISAELTRTGALPHKVPSFLAESLVFNVPDDSFGHDFYVDDISTALENIYGATTSLAHAALLEANGVKRLFGEGQSWSPAMGRDLAALAYQRMGLGR